jgi:hypothetical protein
VQEFCVKIIRILTNMTMEDVGNVSGILGKSEVPEIRHVRNSTAPVYALC